MQLGLRNLITTALRPTLRNAAALRGKIIGGADYAERSTEETI